MNLSRLWKNLFSKRTQQEDIELHFAGAMVRHRHPFEDLEVPRNDQELTSEFINRWVAPFYLNLLSPAKADVEQFAKASEQITLDDIKKMLGDFNWRMRICGAYFAAIKNYKELDEIIGRHLVKSEVTYAADGYCLALATFDTEISRKYLKKYLDYYLDRKDLWFDQEDAFCALEYLDKDHVKGLQEKWSSFVSDKPNWDIERSRKNFAESMLTLEKIRKFKAQ
jgi:hypothetical protein